MASVKGLWGWDDSPSFSCRTLKGCSSSCLAHSTTPKRALPSSSNALPDTETVKTTMIDCGSHQGQTGMELNFKNLKKKKKYTGTQQYMQHCHHSPKTQICLTPYVQDVHCNNTNKLQLWQATWCRLTKIIFVRIYDKSLCSFHILWGTSRCISPCMPKTICINR